MDAAGDIFGAGLYLEDAPLDPAAAPAAAAGGPPGPSHEQLLEELRGAPEWYPYEAAVDWMLEQGLLKVEQLEDPEGLEDLLDQMMAHRPPPGPLPTQGPGTAAPRQYQNPLLVRGKEPGVVLVPTFDAARKNPFNTLMKTQRKATRAAQQAGGAAAASWDWRTAALLSNAAGDVADQAKEAPKSGEGARGGSGQKGGRGGQGGP